MIDERTIRINAAEMFIATVKMVKELLLAGSGEMVCFFPGMAIVSDQGSPSFAAAKRHVSFKLTILLSRGTPQRDLRAACIRIVRSGCLGSYLAEDGRQGTQALRRQSARSFTASSSTRRSACLRVVSTCLWRTEHQAAAGSSYKRAAVRLPAISFETDHVASSSG